MKKNNKGFTLLEVMIALGVLAVSLGVLSVRQQAVLRNTTEMEKLSTATMLARKKMAETEIEIRGLQLGEIKESEEGEFEGHKDFKWIRTVSNFELKIPIPKSEDDSGVLLSTEALAGKLSDLLKEHVKEVRLKVLYTVLGKAREIEIITHIVDLQKDVNITL